MTTQQVAKEINAAKKAIANLPADHQLAPEAWKESLREDARDMSCGGMFRTSPRKAGQSYNAMYAEQRGELTKSKLPAVLRRMLDAGFASTSMWHHTGQFKGHMNRTDFYAGCDFDLSGYEYYLFNKEVVDVKRLKAATKKLVRALRESFEKQLVIARRMEWLKVNAEYVVRTTSRLFIEEKREMNGKYGWFDSSSKNYNLTEYFTGWKLNAGSDAAEYNAII
jgi:hypothetical protein